MEHNHLLIPADVSFLKGGGRSGFKNDTSAGIFLLICADRRYAK